MSERYVMDTLFTDKASSCIMNVNGSIHRVYLFNESSLDIFIERSTKQLIDCNLYQINFPLYNIFCNVVSVNNLTNQLFFH